MKSQAYMQSKLPMLSVLGIKQKILLLAVIPVIILTMVLVAFHIVTRTNDAEQELNRQGSALAQYIAESAEIAFFTGDQIELNNLLKRTLKARNVKGVTFYGADQAILLQAGDARNHLAFDLQNSHQTYRSEQYWFFQQPVLSTQINLGDFDLGDQPSNKQHTSATLEPLGWVQLAIDDTALRDRQRDILFIGLAIGLLGLLLVASLAWRFALSLTRPLSALSQTIDQLQQGNYSARITAHTTGELKTILQGVNRLAQQVDQSQLALQQEVFEATSELKEVVFELQDKNLALEQTGEELVAANAAKDAFLAQMNHELRTPLTSIIGYCRLLSATQLHTDQQQSVQVIEQSSALLLSIIEDVLDFSRLQSNPYKLDEQQFDLGQCLEATAAMHKQAATDKGLGFKLIKSDNLPEQILGDQRRLRQVLNNLLGNAIKFTDSGQVSLSVSLSKAKQKTITPSLVIKISDTGIGIDADTAEHIFEPFVQADSSISKRFGGTGLGLAICQQLVKLMGGKLSLKSKLGSGSIFRFNLPLTNIKATPPTRLASLTSSTAENSTLLLPSLHGTHILIVEDNALNRALLCSILTQAGAKVTEAEHGQQAVELTQIEKPELIVMDLHMPIMDGLTASKQIRKEFSAADLPIIMLTADIITNQQASLNAAGITETHYKPLDEVSLLQAIARLVKANSSKAQQTIIEHADPTAVKDEIQRLYTALIIAAEDKNSGLMQRITHQLKGLGSQQQALLNTQAIASLSALEKALKSGKQSEVDPCLDTALDALKGLLD